MSFYIISMLLSNELSYLLILSFTILYTD